MLKQIKKPHSLISSNQSKQQKQIFSSNNPKLSSQVKQTCKQSSQQKQNQMKIQLQQCDQIQSQSITQQSQHIDQKTSFVSNMTQRKRKEKKKKIVDYLQQNRNTLPTTRPYKNYQYNQESEQNHFNSLNDKGNLQNQLANIQHHQIKNRLFENFIIAFNRDPQKAIQKYVNKNIIKNNQPKTIANYLLKIQGINKITLGQYFGKNDQKVMKILHQYCNLLQLQNLQFDLALRKLLSRFRLPGQAQQIQRIVWQFAQSFYQQNNELYQNEQQLFPLAYSIIMLATDAHNPKQQKKMKLQQFIINTQRACPTIGKQYLEKIYFRIVKQKLQTEKTVYDKLPDLYLTNVKQALKLAEELKSGTVVWKILLNKRSFLKFGKDKNIQFSRRKLFLSTDNQKICWIDPKDQKQQPRFILIKDITDLTIGIAKHLLQKKDIPKQCQTQFFTITTKQRTLDIRTQSSKVRSKWLNYLRSVMIQKRNQKIQYLQRQYSLILRKQNLQQIWNGQIFPHWDIYWDYQLKKPKQKGYFKQKVQKFCYCITKNAPTQNQYSKILGVPIKNHLLQTLWSYGLLPSIRKALWQQIIGNSLQLNQLIVQDIKKRSIYSIKLRQIQQSEDIIQTAEFLITLRPDLPHVKDLLQTSKVFFQVFQNQKTRLILLTNLIHKYHFLSFYKGDRNQIQLRTMLFQFLLQKNTPFVLLHFQAIKLQTRFYLVPWFLSIFSRLFNNDLLLRIWDNFLLEGEIYLFKVGIALIKYYQIQLKMCTFYEALKLLKFSNIQKSSVLFFEILSNQIDVKSQHYFDYIVKRKHAMIKTRIQSIPLQ